MTQTLHCDFFFSRLQAESTASDTLGQAGGRDQNGPLSSCGQSPVAVVVLFFFFPSPPRVYFLLLLK